MLIPRRAANPAVTMFMLPLPDGYTVEGDEHHANAVHAIDRQLFARWQRVSVTPVGSAAMWIQVARLRVLYVWQMADAEARAAGYNSRYALCKLWMSNRARAWVTRLAARGVDASAFPRMMLTPRCSEWRVVLVDFVRVNMGELNNAT